MKAVGYLLKKGVDIDHRDKNGITALLAACHWGNNDIAKLLL
jgi:ankyrin repeat protein